MDIVNRPYLHNEPMDGRLRVYKTKMDQRHMMQKPHLFLSRLIAMALLTSALAAACGDKDASGGRTDAGTDSDVGDPAKTRFVVFSDTHLYDSALGITGDAFEEYLANGQKMIAESQAIFEAMISLSQTSDAEFVLVAGDLTKDGERQSHDLMVAYLEQLEDSGKKVYVVPGNHDIDNAQAYSYPPEGDPEPVPTITAEEFEEIYAAFGYDEAIARDANSLSYIAEPKPGLWILAIDSCNYEGKYDTLSWAAGDLTDETMNWIEERLAEAQGVTVMGLMHHGLVEHFPNMDMIFTNKLLDDWATKAEALGNAGLRAVFTGHGHANDISARKGSAGTVFDIQTGSTVTWPARYRVVEIDTEAHTLDISNVPIIEIDYDLGEQEFQDYAQALLEDGMPQLVLTNLTEGGFDQATAIELEPLVSPTLMAYYAADESESKKEELIAQIEHLAENDNPMKSFLADIMLGIWNDETPDTDVIIDLAAGTITKK